MLVLSACVKAVCRVYVRIPLPPIAQLTSRPVQLASAVSSIWAELADVARFTALETFVQRAHRMGMVRGSRTREGTLAADRGTSAVAAPAASSAASPPVSSVEPPVRGPVVPQAAAGVPSPATVSPSHVSAVKCTSAVENPPPPKPPPAWWGLWAGPGGAPQREPWPGGGITQLTSSANPPFPPIAFNSFSWAWAVRMAPAFSDAVASPRRRSAV